MAEAISTSALSAAMIGISNSAKASYVINIAKNIPQSYDYELLDSITIGTFKCAFVFIPYLSSAGIFTSLSFICVGPNYPKSGFPLYKISDGSTIMSSNLNNSNTRIAISSTTTAIEFYMYPIVNSSATINGCILVF